MNLAENIRFALRAIRGNLLRTILTIMIIAFGIMALVGILTAMESLKNSLISGLSSMGANSFTIRDMRNVHGSSEGKRKKEFSRLTFKQAVQFKERYDYRADVAVSTQVSFMSVVKHGSRETNPNIFVYGVDEGYLKVSGLRLGSGRNFSETELLTGANSIILGHDVMEKLFSDVQGVTGRDVLIGNRKYNIIGILDSRGASMMVSDNIVLIPIRNARSRFVNPNSRYLISVAVQGPEDMDPAIAEATGKLRNIRKLRLSEEDDFTVSKSDSVASFLIENLAFVAIAATLIGLITLLSAAIALMNILLVAVAERTREIGVSKALGAKRRNIRRQFIVESVVICQIGGLLGIVFGILAGNLVSLLLKSDFIVPWAWILLGVTICMVVGIVSGVYPAVKASKLDPIEALRYE